MNHLVDSTGAIPSADRCPPWRYRRPAAGEIVEWGDVRGTAVALPVHFHDEDQLTVVLAGRRRFWVEGAVIALGPGEVLALPGRRLHASLAEPDGVICRNAYLSAGHYALVDLASAMSRLWRQGDVDEPTFLDLLRDHRIKDHRVVAASVAPCLTPHETVAAAAARAKMSREGFSRAFRRTHGLPPRAFRALGRLNAARSLLRRGASPADAAAEAGFADQSHLGRCFRRAFGVTPGAYRVGSKGCASDGQVTSVPDAVETLW